MQSGISSAGYRISDFALAESTSPRSFARRCGFPPDSRELRALRLGQHEHFHSRRRVFLMEDLLCGFHKLLRLCAWDVCECLRITVSQRKPARLHLHHDAMACAEGVKEIWHGEVDLGELARRE